MATFHGWCNRLKPNCPLPHPKIRDRRETAVGSPSIIGRVGGLPFSTLFTSAFPSRRAAAHHPSDQCHAGRGQVHDARQHGHHLCPNGNSGADHRRGPAPPALSCPAQHGKRLRSHRGSSRDRQNGQSVISPTSAENLSLMSSGSVPPNPAELLGSKNMQELLHQLREHYEFIFVDSSPVMAVTDAVLLSTIVDGTLLVVDRNTPKPLLRKALTRLSTPHTKILGTLLNRVDSRRAEYGSYYHRTTSTTGRARQLPPAASSVKSNRGFLKGLLTVAPQVLSRRRSRAYDNERPGGILGTHGCQASSSHGPMAPLVLREHILALGESSDSFPEARLAELVKRVSSEISNDSLRQRFEEEMKLA